MRKFLPLALGAAALAAPASVHSQSGVDEEEPLALERPERDFSGMAERLKDPEEQRQMALMLRTMSEVLLNLPLAPLMEAVGEVSEDITGKQAPEVDPDATLRSIAPPASRVPEQVEKNAPRALDAVGAMAGAFEKMMPAFREVAARMKQAVPPTDR